MDDSVTDLPPADATDELFRLAIQRMIFKKDKEGRIYIQGDDDGKSERRYYPEALTIVEIMQQNLKQVGELISQGQSK